MASPFPLFAIEALRRLEQRGRAGHGGDAFALMRAAGQAGWQCVLTHWPHARRIVVACGPGDNGGDGYMLARHACEAGREVCVVRLQAPSSALARQACQAYLEAGGRIIDAQDAQALRDADLVVDALFGIGLSRAPDAQAAALIAQLSRQPAPILALDVPSGVQADTGSAPGVAIVATRTLQFIARHRGLRTGAALDHAGELALAPLGLPASAFAGIEPAAQAYRPDALSGFFPLRARDAHKGRHGHVLCVGGDDGSGGAILLAADAALHCGAGLASVATRAAHVPAVLARRPEAMAHAVDDPVSLAGLLQRATVIAIGPGLGQAAWGRALMAQVLACGMPRVFDADALNLLAAAPAVLRADDIVTPHPGEAARLLGIPIAEVQRDRFAAAQRLCERLGAHVVLKGAGTLVASPGATPAVICAGNPGMAVGGMGDVLTGCIAALRAQGLPSREAAVAGALLHAAAGDAAARDEGERGLLPSDVLPRLRRLANPVRR